MPVSVHVPVSKPGPRPRWPAGSALEGGLGFGGPDNASDADLSADLSADRTAERTAERIADPTALDAAPPWPVEQLLQPGRDATQLHPALWRANQLGSGRQRTTATGFAALDAQLPGGGWPHGVITELLLPQPGVGELRLLAPALLALAGGAGRATSGTQPAGCGTSGTQPAGCATSGTQPAGCATSRTQPAGCVMLIDPPARLSAWALAQQGLNPRHWLVVQPPATQRQARTANGLAPVLPGADMLWALEQALRSGHVAALLAWLPWQLRADALRRLQLAAQAHDGPVFVFRDVQARSRPSAAPLRLLLQPTGVDGLSLRLLKRRGAPLAQVLRLQLPPVLSPRQQAQALARQALLVAQSPAQNPTQGSTSGRARRSALLRG